MISMGMFDYLRCEYPLPDADMQDHVFQTKSLADPWSHDYVISKDGWLFLKEWDCGNCHHTARHVPVEFSGFIEFHDFRADIGSEWMSYGAIFEHGKLSKLEVDPWGQKITPDSDSAPQESQPHPG